MESVTANSADGEPTLAIVGPPKRFPAVADHPSNHTASGIVLLEHQTSNENNTTIDASSCERMKHPYLALHARNFPCSSRTTDRPH